MITGGPLPGVHDEFSYLLAADTFTSGRLTNPSHPHWVHFETYHVLMQPTYASKYPPAQGLVLALGQAVTGSPAAGVSFGAAIMCAAITWMLLMWLPAPWAVLASVFAIVQLSWLSYWGHSYWGGSVAAAGGALAFGAFRVMSGGPRLAAGFALGGGLGILAASRPYEGAVAGICLAVALGLRVTSPSHAQRSRQLQSIAAAGFVVVMTLAWLGYYNWRVTGSALTLPYRIYQTQYGSNPLLFASPSAKPVYRHTQIERLFREWGDERKQRQQSVVGWLRAVPEKLIIMIFKVLGFGAVALVGLPGIVRWPSLRFVFATICAVIGATLLTAGSFPHYIAPVAPLVYVGVGAALWHLHRKAKQSRSTNFAILSALVMVVFAPLTFIIILSHPHGVFARNRAMIAHQLEALPTKSLVFVVYGPAHNIHEEWVQNRADIDAARIVWARSMTDAQNQKLIDYFPDREVWRLAPDEQIALEPYSPDSRGR
jgi:hypothetical protein